MFEESELERMFKRVSGQLNLRPKDEHYATDDMIHASYKRKVQDKLTRETVSFWDDSKIRVVTDLEYAPTVAYFLDVQVPNVSDAMTARLDRITTPTAKDIVSRTIPRFNSSTERDPDAYLTARLFLPTLDGVDDFIHSFFSDSS